MTPGSTNNPVASISSAAPRRSMPTAAIRPSSIEMSARSIPPGRTMVPPRTTMSAMDGVRERFERVNANGQRDRDVLVHHRLIGMMADAAGTPNEEHGRRHVWRDNHGVVAGAAWHRVRLHTGLLDGAGDKGHERRIQH